MILHNVYVRITFLLVQLLSYDLNYFVIGPASKL